MIIKKLYIYGFGKLNDLTIELHNGINVIEGMNESGKSTMMAFIRSILFGFEGRKNAHLRYEPIHGGKFGGTIEIVDVNNQSYRIERIQSQKVSGDVKVYLPNGEVAGEEVLPQLIGKVSEKVYKQIFSFGLTELQQIDSLQDEEINSFIYHTGTGSASQILKMKQTLEQKQQQLFKMGGKKPEINMILAEMDRIYLSKEKLKQKYDQYQTLILKIKSLEEEIDENELQMERIKKNTLWLEKVVQSYDTYIRLNLLQEQLKEYPNPFVFPEDGMSRLKTLEEKCLDLEVEKENVLNRKVEVEKELEIFYENPFLEENKDKIQHFKNQLNKYQENQREYQSLSQEKESLHEQINDMLKQLGPTFSKEKVQLIEFSIQDKQFLQEYSLQIQSKQRELESVKQRIEDKELRKIHLEDSIYSLKKHVFSEQKADKLEEIYSVIRTNWNDLKEKEWQKTQLEQQRNVYQHQQDHSNSFQSNGILLIMVGIFLLGSIVLFYFKEWLPASLLLFFNVILLTLHYQQKLHVNQGRKLNVSMTQLDEQLEDLQNQITTILKKSIPLIENYGFEVLDEFTINKIEELRAKAISQKGQLDEKKAHLEEINKERRGIRVELSTLQKVRQHLEKDLTTLQKNWKDWFFQHHFDEVLSPLVVFDIIATIQRVKEWIKKEESLIKKIDFVKKEIVEYEKKSKELLEIVGLNGKSIEEGIFQLNERLNDHLQAKQNHQILLEKFDGWKEQLEMLENKIKSIHDQIEELINYAEVKDKEEFYHKAKNFEHYQILLNESRQLTTLLKLSCKTEEEYQRLLKTLETENKEEIMAKLVQFKDEIEKRSTLNKQLLEEKGELQNQIKELEEDQTLTELNQSYVEMQSQLHQKVKEWMTITLAKQIMEKAMSRYEKEKQPQVMKRASHYLSLLTDGEYQQVYVPINSHSVEVIRKDGQRFMPQFLSRGTIEQLFLGLRFALVEEFSNQYFLPIILDDIFVNFDPRRLELSIQALEILAKQHQVIFFTCHPHVTRKIGALIKEIKQISLNHYSSSGII
ncbi:MAG: AAA family ATPase [Tepidibacillus sp.]